MEFVGDYRPLTGSIFFTTDRTIGRNPRLISEALRRLYPSFSAFNGDPKRFDRPHQTHTDRILQVTEAFFALPEEERKALMEGIDAVVSDVRNVCLGISTADCIPVLLYDEEHHAAAAVHAGWRGTLERIVGKAIADMSIAYKTDPKKLKAVIGPGISRKNFEVGDEVYAAFEEAAFDMPTLAQQEIKRNPDAADPSKLFEKKWHIDLKLANRQLLEHAGVADENILESDVCTYDSVDEYFSARRLGTESGRIYSGIIL